MLVCLLGSRLEFFSLHLKKMLGHCWRTGRLINFKLKVCIIIIRKIGSESSGIKPESFFKFKFFVAVHGGKFNLNLGVCTTSSTSAPALNSFFAICTNG